MRRKLAVILASDVAGYSRLMALDEETTVARFAKLKAAMAELVAHYHGRIFNTAGDAVLAEFGSATDAVRCAIEFQETARARNLAFPQSQRMLMRIGIAIGDVLVQDNGDLLGDGVNIAARLEQLAQPGGVVISQDVHGHVERNLSVAVADLGPQTLKNLTRPVHAYALTIPGGELPAEAVVPAAPAPLAAERRAPAAAKRSGFSPLLVSVATLALLGGIGWWYVGQKPRPAPVPQGAPGQAAQTASNTPTQPPPQTQGQPVPAEEFGPKLPAGWTPPDPIAERRTTLIGELNKLSIPPAAGDAAEIAAEYEGEENYKALAVAPGAGYWRVRRAVTEKDAATIALEACHLTYGKPCVLVARGDAPLAETEEARKTPQVMPRLLHSGPFDAAKIPILGPAARARGDVSGYGSAAGPKAMAMHPLGRVSVATGATVQDAEMKALTQCDGLGSPAVEGPCRTYALDNEVVLTQRRALVR